ncbi:MAG: hypothetical protein ACO26G_02910 [Rickettsiales bacterium]
MKAIAPSLSALALLSFPNVIDTRFRGDSQEISDPFKEYKNYIEDFYLDDFTKKFNKKNLEEEISQTKYTKILKRTLKKINEHKIDKISNLGNAVRNY